MGKKLSRKKREEQWNKEIRKGNTISTENKNGKENVEFTSIINNFLKNPFNQTIEELKANYLNSKYVMDFAMKNPEILSPNKVLDYKELYYYLILKSNGKLEEKLKEFRNHKVPYQYIPKSAWGQKVKTLVGDYRWNKISKDVRRAADYVCAYCGERHPEKWGTNAHEEWEWDLETKTQRLKDIKCVCKKCHDMVHPGAAAFFGTSDTESVVSRYARINNVDEDEAYLAATLLSLYNGDEVAKIDWKLDIGEYEKFANRDIIEF